MSTTLPKQKLTFSVSITAPRERIWDALTGDKTFREWCAAFCPGSHFIGDWSEGSKMHFLGPDENGTVGGMVTRITEHRQGEYIRGEHIGVVADGKEIFSGKTYDDWIPATEVYRLTGGPDTFVLTVENDVAESCASFFTEAWQKALATLKEIAERQPVAA